MADITNEYKPNSNRYKKEQKEKEREKRVKEPVATGKVTTKKPSAFRKLTDEIISEDARNVKSYVLGEVLIPAIKKAISDIVTDGIDMILYGGTKKGAKRSGAGHVSYRNYYDDRGGRSTRDTRPLTVDRYSFNDIVLDTRGEAEDVLDRMYELIDTYGLVRVADLYDLVGITGNYTDNKYGWMSLQNADIVRVRDGYMIKMPRAVPID